MKIKQYGPKMEELKREGKTYREIAADVGLKYEQVKRYFSRKRREQRLRGYPRSRKDDALKTNQTLRKELASLRMEVELLRDFLGAIERECALFSWVICGLHREFDKAAGCVIETGKWDAAVWQVPTADLPISRTVTGHFGDMSKAFEFRLSAMGPNGESLRGQTFAVSVAYRICEIENKNYATSVHVNGQLTPAKPEYGATEQDVVLQSMGDAVEYINDCTIEPPATGIDMESGAWMTMLFLSALMGILLSLIRRMRQQ